jgi:hypothetical protein
MNRLDHGQKAMMRALDRGPAHLPGDLFAGPVDRVLAGMKVHANTISHARLVALEETYPRTREVMGHERFNAHSRAFIERDEARRRDLAEIGEDFGQFLFARGESTGCCDLARFEWIWLRAYHAADAEPLELSALAGIDPDALLERMVMRHPAAMADCFDPLVGDLLSGEVPGCAEAEAILIARPQADVLVSPATALMAAMLDGAEKSIMIGNLLTIGSEILGAGADGMDAAMQSLIALLNSGALTAA